MIDEYNNVYENVYEEKGNKNTYENMYILKGSLTEEQAKEEVENIKRYFRNVEIYKKENGQNGYLGLKKLAYTIRENEYGHYCLTHFRANGEDILEIERRLKANDNVIKFITIRTED